MEGKPRPRRVNQDNYAIAPFPLAEMNCNNFVKTFNENSINNTSIIGIAGDDYAFIAVLVRHDADKDRALHRIARRLVLASTGPQCETTSLAALLRARLYMNEYLRQKYMKSRCVALLLSCLLTNASSDPMQHSFMIAGLDQYGKGVIYAYDRLGYHETTKYRAMGNSQALLQSYLNKNARCMYESSNSKQDNDSQLGEEEEEIEEEENEEDEEKKHATSFDSALGIVIRALQAAAACNNVITPQKIVISGITKDGVCLEEMLI